MRSGSDVGEGFPSPAPLLGVGLNGAG